MVKLKHEEKDSAQTEAAPGGEKTCALQRGTQKGLECEEVTQEMIEAGLNRLYSLCDPYSFVSSLSRAQLAQVYIAMAALAESKSQLSQ